MSTGAGRGAHAQMAQFAAMMQMMFKGRGGGKAFPRGGAGHRGGRGGAPGKQ